MVIVFLGYRPKRGFAMLSITVKAVTHFGTRDLALSIVVRGKPITIAG